MTDLFGAPEDLRDDIGEGEAFLHPRLMSGAQGHEALENRLIDSIKNGNLPHGLIFSGPKGIGKATTAYRLIRFLLTHGGGADPAQDSLFGDAPPAIPDTLDVARDDKVFRLIASGAHPDFLSIERAFDDVKNKMQQSVAVADIRKVAPFLRMTSSEGGWRAVLIDDADTMNRNAQNALLKILEEPPEKTLLILIAHRLGTLIPTIRSRTQLVTFTPPPQSVFETILRRFDPAITQTDIELLYAMTQGSPGEALRFMEEEGPETLSRLLDMLGDAPRWKWAEVHKWGGELTRATAQDNAYKNFTRSLLWVLGEMIVCKARGRSALPESLKTQAIDRWIRRSSLEKLLETCENLQDHFTRVEHANLDKKQAVLGAFSIMES